MEESKRNTRTSIGYLGFNFWMVKQNTNAWSKVYRKQCKVERGILTRNKCKRTVIVSLFSSEMIRINTFLFKLCLHTWRHNMIWKYCTTVVTHQCTIVSWLDCVFWIPVHRYYQYQWRAWLYIKNCQMLKISHDLMTVLLNHRHELVTFTHALLVCFVCLH